MTAHSDAPRTLRACGPRDAGPARRRLRVLSGVAAALGLALAFAGSPASAADARSELADLYRLAVSNDLCDFPLSDAQAEALTRRTEELETSLNLDEDATQALYEQVETELTAKVAGGLCKADGEWAKDYARQLEALAPSK